MVAFLVLHWALFLLRLSQMPICILSNRVLPSVVRHKATAFPFSLAPTHIILISLLDSIFDFLAAL